MKQVLLAFLILGMCFQSYGQDAALEVDLSAETVFKVVDDMPRFPGCESDSTSYRDKTSCAREKMKSYIDQHLIYPSEARARKHEGTCVVEFVVLKDGRIANAKLLRDIGYNCGAAALDVINSMNEMEEKWSAGKKDNKAQYVAFTVPIKFDLNLQSNKDKAIRKEDQ